MVQFGALNRAHQSDGVDRGDKMAHDMDEDTGLRTGQLGGRLGSDWEGVLDGLGRLAEMCVAPTSFTK